MIGQFGLKIREAIALLTPSAATALTHLAQRLASSV